MTDARRSFGFSFVPPSGPVRKTWEDKPLEDPEDYVCLVMTACSALAKTDARFRIGGFGTQDWGFDIGYDMSSFVEELPELVEGLRSGTPVEIYLYPQGVDRTLVFEPAGGEVVVKCFDHRNPNSPPKEEMHRRKDLEAMVAELAVEFARSLETVAPAVFRLEPFCRWKDGDTSDTDQLSGPCGTAGRSEQETG
ncbi:hypothetical protein GCM10010406_51710 [Streptomyces thermolineatus]|uniref:Uncharacterized protein n=1 Tax=Streptomyces thermolineatus TaxID=44033 RepID=A0ABN3MUH0_9ACTN